MGDLSKNRSGAPEDRLRTNLDLPYWRSRLMRSGSGERTCYLCSKNEVAITSQDTGSVGNPAIHCSGLPEAASTSAFLIASRYLTEPQRGAMSATGLGLLLGFGLGVG